jgi:hypothetical protein
MSLGIIEYIPRSVCLFKVLLFRVSPLQEKNMILAEAPRSRMGCKDRTSRIVCCLCLALLVRPYHFKLVESTPNHGFITQFWQILLKVN